MDAGAVEEAERAAVPTMTAALANASAARAVSGPAPWPGRRPSRRAAGPRVDEVVGVGPACVPAVDARAGGRDPEPAWRLPSRAGEVAASPRSSVRVLAGRRCRSTRSRPARAIATSPSPSTRAADSGRGARARGRRASPWRRRRGRTGRGRAPDPRRRAPRSSDHAADAGLAAPTGDGRRPAARLPPPRGAASSMAMSTSPSVMASAHAPSRGRRSASGRPGRRSGHGVEARELGGRPEPGQPASPGLDAVEDEVAALETASCRGRPGRRWTPTRRPSWAAHGETTAGAGMAGVMASPRTAGSSR